MKVFTKVVLSWDFEVLESESFEYEGVVALCGGSSGGGGSSGQVDYPSYMKTRHDKWLGDIDALLPIPNPYLNRNAPEITALSVMPVLDQLGSYVNQRLIEVGSLDYVPEITICPQSMKFFGHIGTLVCQLLVELKRDFNGTVSPELLDQKTRLNARLVAISNLNDLEGSFDLETVVFPRFEAGMRDVNAVQSSMFVLGRGVIEGTYRYKIAELREQLTQETLRIHQDLTQLTSQLHLENQKKQDAMQIGLWQQVNGLVSTMGNMSVPMDQFFLDIQKYVQGMRLEVMKFRMENFRAVDMMISDYVGKRIEHGRLSVVADFEQASMNADFDDKECRWDLENFQYAANMLAGIGGGTVAPGGKQPNKFQSALGGALSGAAAGAAMSGGNPIVAGIGGILGVGAALLS